MKKRRTNGAANGRKTRRTKKAGTARKRRVIVRNPNPAPEPIAALSPADAIKGFRFRLKDMQLSSFGLVCSGAVLMIAHRYNKHAQGWPETAETLKQVIADTKDLKEVQTTRIVGLAKELVARMRTKHKKLVAGNPIYDVIECTTHDEAVDSLVAYCKQTLQATSMDALGEALGKYARSSTSRAKAKTKRAERRKTGDKAQGARRGANHPTRRKALPEPIVFQPKPGQSKTEAAVDAFADMAKMLPVESAVASTVKAGHKPVDIAVAALNLVTTVTELVAVQAVVNRRMSLATGNVPTEAARPPRIGRGNNKKVAAGPRSGRRGAPSGERVAA